MDGVSLAFFGFAAVFIATAWWAKLVMSVSIPKDRSVFVILMAVGFGLSVVSIVVGTDSWIASVASGFAIFIAVFFLTLVAVSGQKGGTGQFVIGESLPDFSAPDENGELFSIDSLVGQPIMLKFFRGHW